MAAGRDEERGLLNPLEELARGDLEGLGELEQGAEPDIRAAFLDPGDIGQVQVGLFRQLHLREPAPLAELPDPAAEGELVVGFHEVMICGIMRARI